MCRLLVYKGRAPIQLAHLLTKPEHSIINQAFDSRLRLDLRRPINGDGFGVGWYAHDGDSEIDDTPGIFTSVSPAWNNSNLVSMAEKIKSNLVFAHVRASTATAVSKTNCHPWKYGRFMWMHNGGIAGFDKIKRRLNASLREELYLSVKGNTDSESAFALFLNQLDDPLNGSFDHMTLKHAMLKTIELINLWSEEAGIEEPSLLNFAVTDGKTVICTRYINSTTEEAASLFFSSGTRFECYEPNHYRMVKADRREDIVVVASEPLTFEKTDWLTIPNNTVLIIAPKLNVLLYPIPYQKNENKVAPYPTLGVTQITRQLADVTVGESDGECTNVMNNNMKLRNRNVMTSSTGTGAFKDSHVMFGSSCATGRCN